MPLECLKKVLKTYKLRHIVCYALNMVHTFYVHIFTMDIAYLLTANKLLLIGWNVQQSTSGPRVDPYTRIHLVLDTSHRRTVPSRELDSMLSLDSDQAKSIIKRRCNVQCGRCIKTHKQVSVDV